MAASAAAGPTTRRPPLQHPPAPRGGLVSGCFPLDDAYGSLPDAEALRELKNRASS